MYNYYTDLKRKEKLKEEKKELEKEKQLQKKREKKMKEYSKNYENRIKKFIYSMAEKPIQLREYKKPFLTTREELLFEESNKILFHKGFVFNLYQTDRERLNNYINLHEKESNDLSIYNHNNDYIKSNSFDNKIYSNDNLSNNTNSSFRKSYFKLKSSDLNKTDNFMKNKFRKNKKQNEYSNENNQPQKSIDELFEELRLRDEGKKKIKKKFENNFISLKKNRNKTINSNSYNLNMYNKTYFNAVENYSLFKDSCFLPKKFKNKFIGNEKNNDFPNTNFNLTKNKKYKISNIYENYIHNNNKNQLTDSNIKNEINFSSPNELIEILNNSKPNSKEETLIKSLNNIDLFVQGIKEKKPKLTKKEQFNFDVIKHLAFDNNKKKNFPIIDNNNTSISHIEDNNNIDLSNNSHSNEEYEDYNMKKQVERIKVNGIDYNKNDLENLSKAIMESCKVTKKKFRKDDSKYSHSGNGKLMFTNGLTLKEFEMKYHLNP